MPPIRNEQRISLTTSRMSKSKSSTIKPDFKFPRRRSTRQSYNRPGKRNVPKNLRLFKSLAFQIAIAEFQDEEEDEETSSESEEELDTSETGEDEKNELQETLKRVETALDDDEVQEKGKEGIDVSLEQKINTSDDIPSSEEEYDYVKQNELKQESDFLETFNAGPKVKEIAQDLIDVVPVKKPKALTTQFDTSKDVGTFVNPLTGLPFVASNESITLMFKDLEKELKEAGKDMEQSLNISEDFSEEFMEKDLAELNDKFEDERYSSRLENTAFQLFLTTAENEDQIDLEDPAANFSEEQLLDNQRTVRDFLYKLIDRCVIKAEYSDEGTALRILLDKRKLMTEINSKTNSLQVEKNTLSFLNHKIVDHFKRKKSFRMISVDDPKVLPLYHKRFSTALKDLDKNLIREKQSKTVSSSRTSELRNEFEETKQNADKEVNCLEQLITTTFQSKNFKNFQTNICNSLKRMSTLRNEISEVRLKLFLKQHQYSSLKKRIEKLEDLGHGLNVHHFESLETETAAISKKIEEHNAALQRLHINCNANLHQISHTREKYAMKKTIITAQKEYLEELIVEKKDLRKHVTQLRRKHNSSHYELHNLMYQSGVLFKPELMEDYDKTVQKANKLRQTNENLRRTIEEINMKIATLEKICMV